MTIDNIHLGLSNLRHMVETRDVPFDKIIVYNVQSDGSIISNGLNLRTVVFLAFALVDIKEVLPNTVKVMTGEFSELTADYDVNANNKNDLIIIDGCKNKKAFRSLKELSKYSNVVCINSRVSRMTVVPKNLRYFKNDNYEDIAQNIFNAINDYCIYFKFNCRFYLDILYDLFLRTTVYVSEISSVVNKIKDLHASKFQFTKIDSEKQSTMAKSFLLKHYKDSFKDLQIEEDDIGEHIVGLNLDDVINILELVENCTIVKFDDDIEVVPSVLQLDGEWVPIFFETKFDNDKILRKLVRFLISLNYDVVIYSKILTLHNTAGTQTCSLYVFPLKKMNANHVNECLKDHPAMKDHFAKFNIEINNKFSVL